MGFQHLFDANLQFRPGMNPIVAPDSHEGQLVGSGDGTVRGTAIRGTIHWSNFETQGDRLCAMYPVGVITTHDGTTVGFDARGWALRKGESDVWQVAGCLHLHADGARYDHLNHALAVWEGHFNTSTGTAIWRIYQAAPDAAAG